MATENEIREKLREVRDPEIGMDIVSLGLVRKITLDEDGAEILMTLTSPFCPYADKIVQAAERAALVVPGAGHVRVEITFDPPWEPPDTVRAMMGLK